MRTLVLVWWVVIFVAPVWAETTIGTFPSDGDPIVSADGTRVAFLTDKGITLWTDTGEKLNDFPVGSPAIKRILFDGTTVIGVAKDRFVRFGAKVRTTALEERAHADNAWVTPTGHLYLTRHLPGTATLELLDIDLRKVKAPRRSLLLPYETTTRAGIAVTKDGKTLSLLTFVLEKGEMTTSAHTIDVATWKRRSVIEVDAWTDSVSVLSDDGTTLYRGWHAIDLATGKSTEIFKYPEILRATSAGGGTTLAISVKTLRYSLWTPTSNTSTAWPANMPPQAVSDVGRVLFCDADRCALVQR